MTIITISKAEVSLSDVCDAQIAKGSYKRNRNIPAEKSPNGPGMAGKSKTQPRMAPRPRTWMKSDGAEVASFGPREEQEGSEDRTIMNSVKEMIGNG
jgi:hypothetical protein